MGYNINDMFTRASAKGTIENSNVPHVSTDASARASGSGGICAGITTSWVIAFLNANKNKEAQDAAKFKDFFLNMLRFQGAYMQEEQSWDTIDKLAAKMVINGQTIKRVEPLRLNKSDLPTEGWWAAYVSFRGHAVGIGKYSGRYHIMEPNFGLFTYANEDDLVSDFRQLQTQCRNAFNIDFTRKIACHFYKRSSGSSL